jgi:hypothetical protein
MTESMEHIKVAQDLGYMGNRKHSSGVQLSESVRQKYPDRQSGDRDGSLGKFQCSKYAKSLEDHSNYKTELTQ